QIDTDRFLFRLDLARFLFRRNSAARSVGNILSHNIDLAQIKVGNIECQPTKSEIHPPSPPRESSGGEAGERKLLEKPVGVSRGRGRVPYPELFGFRI